VTNLKKKITLLMMMALAVVLLSGCSAVENKEGFFYSIFVKPFDFSLDYLGDLFGGSYGMAIVVITIIIRLVLMPFMLRTYKRQQGMKVKMDKMRPEMEGIQKRLKETKDKEEQMKLQQEMMGLYKKHEVNPLNMGCLPVVIQMPIIMGLYFAILYSPAALPVYWAVGGILLIIQTFIGRKFYSNHPEKALEAVEEKK